jgi:hypothetical protein
MHTGLAQRQSKSLLDDHSTVRKLEFNLRRNAEQDHTALIDDAARRFRYEDCRHEYWNPENFSLLWGTSVWDQASAAQRIVLNQLYWVAYYAQIVSAEIATIFLNQVSAAGLYTLEDFRLVCDNLDLETKQERAHINAFKTVGETVEHTLFGERLFTYPMRSLYDHTMVFADSHAAKDFWRRLQIQAFTLLSSSNAFLGSQYLLVRGLRTLKRQARAAPGCRPTTCSIRTATTRRCRRRSATGTSWTSPSTSTPRASSGSKCRGHSRRRPVSSAGW